MLINYLTTAWRALRRRPGFAFLNAAGLTVGIACCLLIALFVRHELSYDRFHSASQRIYRVTQAPAEAEATTAVTGGIFRNVLLEDFPEVEEAVRLDRREMLVSRERAPGGAPARFNEAQFFFADSTFFEVFDGFRLVQGNEQTALAGPGSVVLTQATARKYFGDENPVGQTLMLQGGEITATVTGVVENPPANSHFRFDFLASIGTLKQTYSFPTDAVIGSYQWPGMWTYVQLEEGASAAALNARLPEWITTKRETADLTGAYVPHLQPLTDIHLRSQLDGEIQAGGSMNAVYVFSAIAVFILLLACTNFVNLSTARATERAREVGVRRAAGAQRWQVALQFLGEGLLLSLAALVAALGLARMLLPAFGALAGLDAPLPFGGGSFWLVVAGVVACTGLLAGGYPALVLSGFRPADVLKGGARQSTGHARVRRGLVVFQFAVSIALVIATAVALQQLRFLQTKDLGFEAERVVTVPTGDVDYERLAAALGRQPQVVGVARAQVRPGFGTGGGVQFETDRQESDGEALTLEYVGYDFFDVLGVDVLAGRTFSRERPADEGRYLEAEGSASGVLRGRGLVLNRSAAQRLGWAPQEALGKHVRLFSEENGTTYGDVAGQIVGVVGDYHATSLRSEIGPAAYTLGGDFPRRYTMMVGQTTNYALVKIQPGPAAGAMSAVRSAWDDVAPDRPFEASFLDASLDQRYRREARTGRVLATFAGLALLVAALGLFGLAAYAAQARRKEIAVRKVLGASAASVVALLSKDFLLLVLAGFALAVPLAWIGMQRWLDGFAYRIELGPLVFAAAGGVALLVAALTVSTQALRAARANPAEALRDE